MLRILSVLEEPIHILNYCAPIGDGTVNLETLPLHLAFANGLPASLDGLLLTADLQGVEMNSTDDDPPQLLGVSLATEICDLGIIGVIPEPQRIGVCVCGDLYTQPDLLKRGTNVDVRHVWDAFAERFRWVVGVAGNHDRLGNSPKEQVAFAKKEGIHFLDGNNISINGLVIGGISGIIGNPRRPFRHDEETFCRHLRGLLSLQIDIILLHEGPQVDEIKCKGNPAIRSVIDEGPQTLVVCGHCNWEFPGLWESANGTQVLNVVGRAVLLVRDSFRGVL